MNVDEDFKSFDDMLAGLSLRSAQIHKSVRGAAIERYRGGPSESRNAASPQHTLVMCSNFPARFESVVGHHNSVSYVKAPGAISLEPAGVIPVMSARSDFELLVCTMDVSLVNEVHAELDRRPEGELRCRTNFEDTATQQLMKLLFDDSADGYPAGKLYTDHLIHALACRFLVIGRERDPQSTVKRASPLPLKLRVDRVRELLASSTLSLTDIALECGFSSHSHLSRVFRQVLGATPSEYRRSL
jgi:AraC family transcriptional regulator